MKTLTKLSLFLFLIGPLKPAFAGPYPGAIKDHGHSGPGDGGTLTNLNVLTRISVGSSTMTTTGITTPSITTSSITTSGITVNRATVTFLVDQHSPYINAFNYGVTGDGSTDDTIAFQNALNAMTTGQTLILPNPRTANNFYRITSPLTIAANRITIQGENRAEVVLKFITQTAQSLFNIPANKDNIIFKDFSVEQSSTTVTNCKAFTVTTGASNITWDGIYFVNWSRYAINLATNHYIRIKNCRFLNTRDTSSSFRGIAINGIGNDYIIRDNLFSGNDQLAQLQGTKIVFDGNTAEVDGSSGNNLIDRMIQCTSCNNFTVSANYFEGEQTNGGDLLRITDSFSTTIENNYFQGQDGGVDKTTDTIRIDGISRNTYITGNQFNEVVTNFIDNVSTGACRVWNNSFIDGGSVANTWTGVMNHVSFPELIDLDYPSNLTWDAPPLTSTNTVGTNFEVVGSSFPEYIDIGAPANLQGLIATAYPFNSTGTIRIQLTNVNATGGGGSVDLPSFTWKVRIRRGNGS